MKYKGVDIPKRNGRPQLWTKEWHTYPTSLRIVYPNGKVEVLNDGEPFQGCTSRKSQLEAIKAIIDYDNQKPDTVAFLGYL